MDKFINESYTYNLWNNKSIYTDASLFLFEKKVLDFSNPVVKSTAVDNGNGTLTFSVNGANVTKTVAEWES